ncbi:hypothetical protein HGA92_04450 [Candidatus Gracilibacteria bacterium]|nr:hypothetical protein [Candidatus Gracilibacteria bacterium]NUJ98515.1 hypothetical protein [Candidatus Gracilibacteria bacterium]
MFENEKIVETKTCKHCGSSFDITDKDLEFYEKVSPVFPNPGVSFSTPGLKLLENGKIKYLIPSPTLCPQCREQRRMTWRNERKIYKRKCDFSGIDLVSMYSPDKNLKVFHNKYWWGDSWDGLNQGKDVDFSRPIFEQLNEVSENIPRLHRFCYSEDRMENSEYTNCSGDLKNCYLIFGANDDENCMYSTYISYDKDCIDCFLTIHSKSCYESVNLDNCFKVFYGFNSKDCNDCNNIIDCLGCKECIGCIGLRNNEYHILNKKYPKEEYLKKKAEIIKNGKLQNDFIKEFNKLALSSPRKYLNGINNYNVTGDFIHNSKNLSNCYDANTAEDCKNCTWFMKGKDCMDFFSWGEAELCYEISGGGDNMYQCAFTAKSFGCRNGYYTDLCVYCEYCFLCVGLKYKKYCILNKQYTKEKYEILVPKIIEHMMKTGEWGEFFPSSLSPFGYNETVAQEYYPLTRRDVIPAKAGIYQNENISSETGLKGEINYIDREGNTHKTLEEVGERPVFKWSNYETPFPKVEKIIPASKLPENIADIPDDILNWAIECEVTKKPFRIIKEELAFYRKHNLPIPRRHPDQRHLDRMSLRNPRHLYSRNCDKCGKEIQTTYAPERPEIVYCEECYNKEIY